MSKRSTITGLAVLCALALSAIAASGAYAGTTEFTCIEGGEAGLGKFSDADCATSSAGGKFGHVPITEKTTTVADKLTNPILEGKLFGANVELEATGLECIECTSENREVGGVMEFTGSGGKIRFTGVRVVGMEAKCTVVGSAAGTITTEKGRFTTTVSTGATIEPESGTTLAIFSITGSGCTVAGTNYKVTGKAAVAHNGAQLVINVTKASGELTLEGEKASAKGQGTVTGGKIGSEVRHPISLTTTTP